ncbi:MAG: hypothetical protein AB1656_23460 [Candidatus Omnitrophota bacterium]
MMNQPLYLGTVRIGERNIQLAGYNGPPLAVRIGGAVFVTGDGCEIAGRIMNPICFGKDCGCGPDAIVLEAAPEKLASTPAEIESFGRRCRIEPYHGAYLVIRQGGRLMITGRDCEIVGAVV